MGEGELLSALESLYASFNRREYVHPDPLEFLYDYDDPREREVVGIVASSLAYGRVGTILSSISDVLGRMEPSPLRFVLEASAVRMGKTLAGFKHRFTSGEQLAALLYGLGKVIRRHGSVERCFAAGLGDGGTVIPALAGFVEEVRREAGAGLSFLFPSPSNGSACKRPNLYLRWMVRRDDVDPGGWEKVKPAALVVPLDTHMHRIARELGLTSRRSADLRTALEVTEAFRRICPQDPVRYDFALTRLGIRPNAGLPASLPLRRELPPHTSPFSG